MRKALTYALAPKLVRTRRPGPPEHGVDVVVALRFRWAVLGAPSDKRLTSVMDELVATLRRFEERAHVAATTDRHLLCRGVKANVVLFHKKLAAELPWTSKLWGRPITQGSHV